MFRLAILFCTVTVTLANVYSLAPRGYLYALDFETIHIDITQLQCFGVEDNSFATAVFRANEPITNMTGSTDYQLYFNTKAAAMANLQVEFYYSPVLSDFFGGITQFDTFYNYMSSLGIRLRFIWFKIAEPSQWNTNVTVNNNLINDIRSAAMIKGVKVGFYTSAKDFNTITGGTTSYSTQGDNLWYISNNGDGVNGASPADFNDFKPFGGWKKPDRKQFASQIRDCGGFKINKSIIAAYPNK